MIIRSTSYSAAGGDTIQARQTARVLASDSIAVEIKLTNEAIDYASYDLLHFFNITRPADILCHIRKSRLPFVVSTILVNYSEYDKHNRKGLAGLLFRHLHPDAIEYVKAISRWAIGRDTLMSFSYAWKGQRKAVTEIISKAGLLLPNSTSEYARLRNMYGCDSTYSIVPNGVDTSVFRFNRNIRKDPKLVLCVARIEGIKNQQTLIRALNNTMFRLVIIGACSPNQRGYYLACRRLAASNVTFLGHVTQAGLVAYYQQAKVHVLPSWFETTGLSSLEAAAMGCNIVITDRGDTTEYFGDDAFYCEPSSPESIYAAIEKAALSPLNEGLQNKISTSFTWQQASLRTEEGYKKILSKSWN